MALFADIIVDISIEKLDRPFLYSIPERFEERVTIGSQVVIPFGRGNMKKQGFVVGLHDEMPENTDFAIKPISDVLEGRNITSQLISLAQFISRNYGGTLNAALRTVLPSKKKGTIKEIKYVRRLISSADAKSIAATYERKHKVAMARLLFAIAEDEVILKDVINKKLNVTDATIKKLEEEGFLEIKKERTYRRVLPENERTDYRPILNEEQKNVVTNVLTDYENKEYNTYLIHGVTGSGKTEVYMEIADAVIRQGRQVIILIPEIALTYQTLMRFYRRFGERIAVMNSRLSEGERFDEITRIENGEVDLVIGPRSALFAPFNDLGLIIIDEEHEGTYKSEQIPRYHAVDVARERARLCNATVILGSATPSLKSYYLAQKGEYKLFTLKNRFSNNKLPNVTIVDLRDELVKGNRSIFSDRLRELIKDRLNKKEQTMLFLNRRGMASFISCRKCGYVAKCINCDVSLTAHKNGMLKCHYCGYEIPMHKTCPSCGSKYIGGFKIGTEKVEELIKQEFPEARVLRMDADTTAKKTGHEEILSAFANQEADILIGTQMIVKGHDFPNVTLVGVLAADMSLYSNNYLASERTFELLTQAVGRAGRGEKEGEAIIQTYSPEHFAIETSKSQDYETFYNNEITFRKVMNYPPIGNLLVVFITSEKEKDTDTLANEIFSLLEEYDEKSVAILGPVDATIKKVQNNFRKVIYIKSNDYDKLVERKNIIERYRRKTEYKMGTVLFDFNPISGF